MGIKRGNGATARSDSEETRSKRQDQLTLRAGYGNQIDFWCRLIL